MYQREVAAQFSIDAENPHLIADALRELGAWLNRNNRFAESVQVTKAGLALAELVGDQTKVVAILNNLGHALVHQGAWEEATAALTRGYELAREIDYYRAFVVLAGNLGCLYAQQGEWQTAVSSATGYGEAIMKVMLSKRVADFVAAGHTAQQACAAAIDLLAARVDGVGGLIAIDRHGQIGFAYNTDAMPYAYSMGDKAVVYGR